MIIHYKNQVIFGSLEIDSHMTWYSNVCKMDSSGENITFSLTIYCFGSYDLMLFDAKFGNICLISEAKTPLSLI